MKMKNVAEYRERGKEMAVALGAMLDILMLWAAVFPQTGGGDAIMHYLNAHDGLWQPAKNPFNSAAARAPLSSRVHWCPTCEVGARQGGGAQCLCV